MIKRHDRAPGRLTVIGNTTVDVFVRGIESLPEKAEDEFSNASFAWINEPVVLSLGGNGGNTAYVFASLGGQVRLWSSVGADAQGSLATGWLQNVGVDTRGVEVHDDAGTSTTVVITDVALRRHTYHAPAASGVYGPDSVGEDLHQALKPRDWLLATGYTLLPRWRGEPFAELLQRAHEKGVFTALDFGPALGAPVTRDELRPVLPHLSLLISNRFELEQATGAGMEEGAAWALDGGVQAVAVKLGRDGAALFSNSLTAQLPAFKVEVTGTVGAGDAFNAGLLFAYSQGASLQESARFANATAALVATSPRGVLDAPNHAAVLGFLKN